LSLLGKKVRRERGKQGEKKKQREKIFELICRYSNLKEGKGGKEIRVKKRKADGLLDA